jgi:NitT/TauT family transport system permease protein
MSSPKLNGHRKWKRALPWLGFAIVIAVWWMLAEFHVVNPLYLASLQDTSAELWRLLAKGTLPHDMADSLRRIFISLGLSIAIGLPLGLFLGLAESVNRLLQGFTDFLRSIPPIIVYPICQFIFGPLDASRIAVAVFGATSIIVLNTSEGVRNCSKLRQQTNRLLGAKWHHVICGIILFESLPAIIVAIRSALSLCIIIVTVTQMLVGAPHALGSRLVNAQISYSTAELFALIILIGFIGFASNWVLIAIERIVVHWRR